MEKALRQTLPVPDSTMCVVDTRALHNPDDNTHRMHFGTHPANFASIVHHRYFKGVVGPAAVAMLRALKEDSPPGGRTLTLVFMCKSGRHRSVACARVAAEVATVYPSFRLTAVTNLTPMSVMPHSCGMCEACAFWNRTWDAREKALTSGVQHWEECAGG